MFKDNSENGVTADYGMRTVAVRDRYNPTGRMIRGRFSDGLLVFTIFIDNAPFGIKSMGR
jgi:hypothetical protein